MDQENINSIIGVEPELIAKLHLFYRSSVIGRRSIGNKLATTIKTLKDFKYEPEFKNRNVEILQAYFKAMGVRIEFDEKMYEIPIELGDMMSFEDEFGYFIGTQTEYDDYEIEQRIRKEYSEDVCFVGTSDEFESTINKEVETTKLKRDYYYIDIE